MAVIYPKFLRNMWAAAYNDTAQGAETNALNNLTWSLDQSNIPYDMRNVNVAAMYTGDLPNALPVRLELWEK